MTYVPALPASGLVGWKFLQKTQDTQTSAFGQSPEIKRNVSIAQDSLGTFRSAKELVSDRNALNVVLTAFGLENDVNSQFFIQKILESDLTDKTSLANRLSDARYKSLTKAMSGLENGLSSRAVEDVVARYKDHSFEIAIGDQDETMRLALNAQRELADIAKTSSSENTKWYSVMGNPPLKKVFETVFRLPSSFGKLDLDRQLNELKKRSEATFGSSDLAKFGASAMIEKVVEKFLLQSQISSFDANLSSSNIALTLLQTESF